MPPDIRHFAADLQELKSLLLLMGGLAEERVRQVIQALISRDRQLTREVVEGDQRINELHVEIDDQCFKLLALHQPVAIDLRVIVAALKINSDLERIGDLAVNIGEAASRYIAHPPVKPLVDIPRMAAVAQEMLHRALDAFVEQRPDDAQLVMASDDLLDSLKNQVFRELLTYMLGDVNTIEPGLDLILISRHLERVGDHATNIAEDVIFIVEGRDVRHHAGD